MAQMKHALLPGSRRHIRECGEEYITGSASQVKTGILEELCNTGLLDCAVISAGRVALLQDAFQA